MRSDPKETKMWTAHGPKLLVWLGLKPDLADFLNEDGSISGCFDANLLKPINLERTVSCGGMRSTNNVSLKNFTRDRWSKGDLLANSKYKVNGESTVMKRRLFQVKFPKQGQFLVLLLL